MRAVLGEKQKALTSRAAGMEEGCYLEHRGDREVGYSWPQAWDMGRRGEGWKMGRVLRIS